MLYAVKAERVIQRWATTKITFLVVPQSFRLLSDHQTTLYICITFQLWLKIFLYFYIFIFQEDASSRADILALSPKTSLTGHISEIFSEKSNTISLSANEDVSMNKINNIFSLYFNIYLNRINISVIDKLEVRFIRLFGVFLLQLLSWFNVNMF